MVVTLPGGDGEVETRGLAPPHHPGWPTRCHLGCSGVVLGKVVPGCKCGHHAAVGRQNRDRIKEHGQEGSGPPLLGLRPIPDDECLMQVCASGARARAPNRAKVVDRPFRARTEALLEVFEPTNAASAGLPPVLPTPRAADQTALPQSMLQRTASDLLSHFTSY